MSERKMMGYAVDAFEGVPSSQIDISLPEALRQLQAAAAEVPPEYREVATLYLWCDDDDRTVCAEFQWQQPETDEQQMTRIADEAALRTRVRLAEEARERALLAALKAKYES